MLGNIRIYSIFFQQIIFLVQINKYRVRIHALIELHHMRNKKVYAFTWIHTQGHKYAYAFVRIYVLWRNGTHNFR